MFLSQMIPKIFKSFDFPMFMVGTSPRFVYFHSPTTVNEKFVTQNQLHWCDLFDPQHYPVKSQYCNVNCCWHTDPVVPEVDSHPQPPIMLRTSYLKTHPTQVTLLTSNCVP